jgi:hypothetical protein
VKIQSKVILIHYVIGLMTSSSLISRINEAKSTLAGSIFSKDFNQFHQRLCINKGSSPCTFTTISTSRFKQLPQFYHPDSCSLILLMALPPLETISSKIKSESVTTKHHQTIMCLLQLHRFLKSRFFRQGPALLAGNRSGVRAGMTAIIFICYFFAICWSTKLVRLF